MKRTFKAATFSRLWAWRPRTLAGVGGLTLGGGRTAAGQVVDVGVVQAAEVSRPWGALAGRAYSAGTAKGENYA
jgi:hypothetical protein